ncbi:efflux transporter, RND family, MFP subunit [Bordetella bronchiseptica OSU553]|nr:efflux transporter, RND family, MFP subunit [Bordetella bronchiseptica OSU553]
MKSKKGTLAAGIVAAMAIAGGAWLYLRDAGSAPAWTMAPVKVAAAPAALGPLPVTLAGIGTLQASRQVVIPAEVDGRIARIAFESGQAVQAGQVLAQLNDAPEQGDLARLQAQLRNARSVLERTRRLVPQQAATAEQLDQARAAYDQAAGEVRRVQALVEQKQVKAPFDGVLGVRRVDLGQFVRAGEPVVSLTDARTMYADITLPEQALRDIRTGQAVSVGVDAYPGRAFDGVVSTIEPQVSAQARTLLVRATLPNPDGVLAPGMYVNARVALPERPGVITVPETAVSYSAYGDSVYVVDDTVRPATVRQVFVKTAERVDSRIVVTEGLQAGQRVVTSGQLRLHNGAAVEVFGQDTLAAGGGTALASH